MMPILYNSTENQFITNGIGILADAVSCKVTEELNGEYELEMVYPIDGIHYAEIKNRRLLFCNANKENNPQPFRIYRITKPINGKVKVYAAHISYDLSGVPVRPFTSNSAAAAITALETGAAVDSPFTFWTDKTNAGNLTVATPLSTRFVLGEGDNSIIRTYGGELEFDRYTVKLHGQRGTDRGVSIRYGKNLTSLEQDENNSNVYTGVYPYYSDGDSITQLDELIVPAPGTYDYTRILPLDLSSEFDSAPTKAQLKEAAEAYIANNNIGIPEVTLAVSFALLEQTEEYKHLALSERVFIGDTVNVEFAALGVSATARCVKTIYNVLLERYDSVELGDARTNIADANAAQQQAINAVANGGGVSTAVQNAINAATALITGNKGGYVLLHSTTGSKQPDEILIMDEPSIEEAVKVWRWNNSGLGYSSTGYNGPYETAITQDGQIVADFITTGGMNAARITAGILSSADGRVQFDLTAGTLYIRDGNNNIKLGFDAAGNLTITGNITATGGKIGGFTISGNNLNGSYIKLRPSTSGGEIVLGDVTLNGASGLEVDAVNTSFLGGINISGGRYFEVDSRGNMSLAGDMDTGGEIYTDLPSSSGGSTVYWGESTRRLVYHGSSERYKKNIESITEEEANKLLEVRPVSFYYNDDPEMPQSLQYGVIAEELHGVYPAMIGYKNGLIDNAHYEQFFGPIIKMLQMHDERLKKLEGEN